MVKQASAQHGKHLDALLTGSSDAILAINAEGIIKFANEEACSLTGRSMNELIGESIVEVYANIETARAANRKIYQAGGTIHNMETTVKTKDGKLVPVRVSASHLYDSNGTYIGGVGYFLKYKPMSVTEAQMKASLEQIEGVLGDLRTIARTGVRNVSRTVGNITTNVSTGVSNIKTNVSTGVKTVKSNVTEGVSKLADTASRDVGNIKSNIRNIRKKG